MTSRERVLRTFSFEHTDRTPFDIMEGIVWPELMDYFQRTLGLQDLAAVQQRFDVDFRWFMPAYNGPHPIEITTLDPEYDLMATYSDNVNARVLAQAHSVADLDRHSWPDPAWWDASAIRQAREADPDRALVLSIGWWLGTPLFCQACNLFGIEEALVKMISEPLLFEAYVQRQNEFVLALLERCLTHAEGVADICWLADDVATQRSLMMSPDSWRRYFKEPMRKQAELARRHGLFTLFHSCGAVREILPDLLDIGIDGLLTFQTSADGMDAVSIARDFGGKLVFYGGIDVQQTLSFATEAEVEREVRTLMDLFADCGGFILSNSHNIQSIRPANVVAMLSEARRYRPGRSGKRSRDIPRAG